MTKPIYDGADALGWSSVLFTLGGTFSVADTQILLKMSQGMRSEGHRAVGLPK